MLIWCDDEQTEGPYHTGYKLSAGGEQVGLFARLRWIVTPGSDLYLVYTQNWLHCMDGIDKEECSPLAIANRDFVTLSRGGSVKLSYTYRF